MFHALGKTQLYTRLTARRSITLSPSPSYESTKLRHAEPVAEGDGRGVRALRFWPARLLEKKWCTRFAMDKKTRRQQVLAKQGVGFRAITRGPWLFPQVAALGQAGVVHTSFGQAGVVLLQVAAHGQAVVVQCDFVQGFSFRRWRLLAKQRVIHSSVWQAAVVLSMCWYCISAARVA